MVVRIELSRMEGNDINLWEIRSLSDMERAREAWTRLVFSAPGATPFQSWEWNFGLASFEDTRVRLRIVMAENSNGDIVGIAPFWIRRSGLPGMAVVEFIGSRLGNCSALLVSPSFKYVFVRRLVQWIEQNPEWRIINLQHLRKNAVDMLSQCGSFDIRPSGASPYVNLPKSIEEYERMLQKKLRQTIKRQSQVLSSAGRMAFSVYQTASDIRRELSILFDLHQKRQQGKGERGRFFSAQWKKVFTEMSLTLTQPGILRLGMLRIDGQAAACVYSLRLGDAEYPCYIGLDPRFAVYSPGSLLHFRMISEAIKDGLATYDLGKGNEHYKSWWSHESYQLYDMVRARSNIEASLWRQYQSWHTAIYKSQFVKRLYQATVAEVQDLRSRMG
jgi:CelD/BcsL family acetyltransferase involved in cellulose biosynthesis